MVKIYDNYISRQSGITGFTLIELLIAVLLAAIVTSAAMGIYIAQHKQLIVLGYVYAHGGRCYNCRQKYRY